MAGGEVPGGGTGVDDRFDHAWWAMALIGLDGRFVRVNQPLCDLLGRSRDDLCGRSVFEIVPASEIADELAGVRDLLDGAGHVMSVRRQLQTADGVDWEGDVVISVIRDDDGDASHLHLRLVDPPERRRPPERIARLEGDFHLSLDQMTVGIAVIGLDAVPLAANPAMCRITGRSEDELRGLDLLSMTHPDDRAEDVRQGAAAWAGEFDSYTIEKRLVRPDGSVVWVRQEVTFIRDHDGELLHLLGQVIDITPRKEAEAARDETRREYEDLLEGLPIGVVRADAAGRIISANPAAAAMVGLEALEPGFDAAALVHPDDWDRVMDTAMPNIRERRAYHVEFRLVRPDGEVRWIRSDARPVIDATGRFDGLAGTWLDVTVLKETEARLRREATHDPLTGLANRLLLFEVLGAAIARARRADAGLAVLFIDLDGFKAVNDTYGHRAGDSVLVRVGQRLLDEVRGGDLVARIGGDEFTVLCEGLDEDDPLAEAGAVAERVVAAMDRPFEIDGDLRRIGASVGVALWQPDVGPDDLVSAADRAVYAAKRAGRGRVGYAGRPSGR